MSFVHLTDMFPALPGQSGYNKRVRAAGTLISVVITELARDTPSWHELLRLVDSTPVPAETSRETVKRSDLAGDAGYGYCASHSRFFWGFRLYLIATPVGMPVIWALANPKIGEREVTQAMLHKDHHLIKDRGRPCFAIRYPPRDGRVSRVRRRRERWKPARLLTPRDPRRDPPLPTDIGQTV